MQRLDRDWLLYPILAALGHGVALSTACGRISGGSVELPEDGMADASPRGSAGSPLEPPRARAGSSGAGGTGGGTSDGQVTEPVEIWRWETGAEPDEELTPPTECRGIDGAEQSEPSDAPFNLSVADVTAFCAERAPEGLAVGLCLPAPPPGRTCAETYSLAEVAAIYECGYDSVASFACGARSPVPGAANCAGDECCYAMVGGCAVGRPFLVQGVARVAGLVSSAGWLTPRAEREAVNLTTLDAASRRALADFFARDGLSEHASVASFARFALECLALGAPAELVLGAQRAAIDEIEHARTSFGLASAYAGAELGPSALDVSGGLPAAPSPEDAVLRTVREGCIAETVSAALLHEAAEAATEPAVKSALSRAAEDEKRHAALAWRFVRWALESGGAELRDAVKREFLAAREHVGFGALTQLPGDAAAMRAHGYLGVSERRLVAELVLQQVVSPCARLLLNPPSDATVASHGAPASTPPQRYS